MFHRHTMRWLLVAALALAALAGRHAAAAPASTDATAAKGYYEKATSAFGLGDYARAAELYEKAFELRADSALLYNAAQSHRLAGHRERALQLYRNHVRLFPDAKETPDARRHIDELTSGAPMAPVGDPVVSPVPSSPTAPPPAQPTLALTAPPPSAAAAPRGDVDLVRSASAAPATTDSPRRSRTWVWIALGGVVVVAGAVTAAILLAGNTHDPSPTLGTVGGGTP